MRSSNFIPIFPRYALYSFLSQPVYFRLGQIIIELKITNSSLTFLHLSFPDRAEDPQVENAPALLPVEGNRVLLPANVLRGQVVHDFDADATECMCPHCYGDCDVPHCPVCDLVRRGLKPAF